MCLPQLFNYAPGPLRDLLQKAGLTKPQVAKAATVVDGLPQVNVKWTLDATTIAADETGTISVELERNKAPTMHTKLTRGNLTLIPHFPGLNWGSRTAFPEAC